MKLTIIFIISALLLLTNSVNSIEAIRKSSFRLTQQYLPTTPKGSDLSNNNGIPAINNVYGANQQYDQNSANPAQMTILKPDGSIQQIVVNQNELNIVQKGQCDASQNPAYKLCAAIDDCDLCSANDVCGWCRESSKCMPGNIGNAVCPGDCLSKWIFEKGSCTGKVKSGSIGNVAEEATKLITPEYTDPKIKIHTYTTEHNTITKQVQVGVQSIKQSIQNQHPSGIMVNSEVEKQVPLMGSVNIQIPYSHKLETSTYSLADGRKLDIDESVKGLFGTDNSTVAVNSSDVAVQDNNSSQNVTASQAVAPVTVDATVNATVAAPVADASVNATVAVPVAANPDTSNSTDTSIPVSTVAPTQVDSSASSSADSSDSSKKKQLLKKKN